MSPERAILIAVARADMILTAAARGGFALLAALAASVWAARKRE